MENLDKETIEKIISELLKVLKKIEDKESLKNEGNDIEVVEVTSREVGRVIGTFAKINNFDIDFGLEFSEEQGSKINLKFDKLLFQNLERDLLKNAIEAEVSNNQFLNRYNLEIE